MLVAQWKLSVLHWVSLTLRWPVWQLRSGAMCPDELRAPLASGKCFLETAPWAEILTSWYSPPHLHGGRANSYALCSSADPLGLWRTCANLCLLPRCVLSGTSPRRRPSLNTARNGRMMRARSSWRRTLQPWRSTARSSASLPTHRLVCLKCLWNLVSG